MAVADLAGFPVKSHQPGMIPLVKRMLGNQLLGKIVVKIASEHKNPSISFRNMRFLWFSWRFS